jgi:nicotinic acid phosphoribosyltransferase
MTTDEAIKWSRESFHLMITSKSYTEAYHFYGYSWGTINAFGLMGIINYLTECRLKAEALEVLESVKEKVGYN